MARNGEVLLFDGSGEQSDSSLLSHLLSSNSATRL